MYKGIKLLVAFCAVALALMLMSTLTFAAGSLSTGITGLSAEYDGDATWTYSDGTIAGTVAAKVTHYPGTDTFKTQSGTLTFKNSSASTKAFMFDYAVELNQGTVTVDGTQITERGTFIKKLEADETVTVVMTSNAINRKVTSFEISNIRFVEEQDVSVTFKAPVNGSYKVNGESITAETVKTFKTTDQVQLVATGISGYKIYSWNNETDSAIFSTSASLTTSFVGDCTVSASFIESSTPVFRVGDSLFSDYANALALAVSGNDKTVILISSGTLPAGNYLVPNGITLLLPYSGAYNVVKDKPDVLYNVHTDPTAYVLLTMEPGANITVENGGSLSVAGQLCSKGQMAGWNGTPTGPAGRISMNDGSSITLEDGGTLYCWGYIYGSGSVTAESGSTVYEAFQVKDWRGGSASSTVYDYAFILSQYYIQNIEVPLTIYAGATEVLYTSVNASNAAYPASSSFIGPSDCLFNVSNGYVIKDYIESTDRLQVDVYGDISVSPMILRDLPVIKTINTKKYILPITSNLTINIHSGTTTVLQDIELLPGVEFTVDNGAEVVVGAGKKVYVYDNDDWGIFTGTARLYVIGYSVANGTTTIRNNASLVDALVDINGTLTVSGGIFTSLGGANITSSNGTGTVVLSAAVTSEDVIIYEMANNADKTEVTFNPARLHNGSGRPSNTDEYIATAGNAAGTSYFYCHGCDMWLDASVAHTHTITWVIDGVEEHQEVAYGTVPSHADPEKAADSSFEYSFITWFPVPVEVTGDATYIAEFAASDVAPSTDDTSLKPNSRTLFIYNDLSIVYKVNKASLAAYTDPYMIFTINNRAARVNGTLKVDTDNVEKYFFEFKNVNPQQMATNVYTYLYAEKNGSLCKSAMYTYSVRAYAENQLAKASTPAVLRTLLVDLLNYGADAQLYTEHRMIDLANSTLSAEQLGYATAEVPELTSVAGQGPEIESPSVAWKAVTLMLDNAVQIRLKVECADISGVKASVVTDYGRTFEITSDKLVPVGSGEPNRYFLFINELNFARLRNKYDITFVNDAGTPVSRTFSYSVASYAAGRINGTTAEAALLRSLMKFGASAEAYVASLSN